VVVVLFSNEATQGSFVTPWTMLVRYRWSWFSAKAGPTLSGVLRYLLRPEWMLLGWSGICKCLCGLCVGAEDCKRSRPCLSLMRI
jgi:hypothetical protein